MHPSTQLTSGSLAANGIIYLALAGMCLLVALQQAKHFIAPVAPLIRAVTAAATIVFCVGAALVLLVAALVSGR
ncbi:hypothetical protein [Paractinoplanes brasiliensis]|uniref:hypothetical protein n=1 Tax=Paractinoplanes brasiliensis TaxID=52695 RepID=UPI0010607E2E|nr:hypothetical protein [Actinoplanes brasiliensis]